MSDNAQHRAPSMLDAVIPVISLVLMLIASVTLYGADSSYGPNQIALLLAAGIAAIIGIRNGMRWKQIEDAIISGIGVTPVAVGGGLRERWLAQQRTTLDHGAGD